jgi:predicted alpha/beta superfamily hydrolase
MNLVFAPVTTWLLLAFVCLSGDARAEDSQSIVLGQRLSIHSEILKQDRPYLVYLPPSYDAEAGAKRFPVMYLLDGGAHFNAATGVVHHLSSPNSGVGRIPEMIIVALPNAGRTHNMTPTHVDHGPYSENSGGAADFLRFLREELLPAIAARFRTSDERILVGHSLAGLFALNVFLEEPAVFDHYIAIDPSLWWDSQLLVHRFASLSTRTFSRPITVFIAQANSPARDYDDREIQKQHESGIRNFNKLLSKRQNSSLRAGYEFLRDETHMSAPLMGMYRGLLFTYPEL